MSECDCQASELCTNATLNCNAPKPPTKPNSWCLPHGHLVNTHKPPQPNVPMLTPHAPQPNASECTSRLYPRVAQSPAQCLLVHTTTYLLPHLPTKPKPRGSNYDKHRYGQTTYTYTLLGRLSGANNAIYKEQCEPHTYVRGAIYARHSALAHIQISTLATEGPRTSEVACETHTNTHGSPHEAAFNRTDPIKGPSILCHL